MYHILYIKDKSDNKPIGISHITEISTATRFPVWSSDNTIVSMTATNLRNATGKAPNNHSHSNYVASNHTHTMVNDFNSGEAIGISSSVVTTPATAGDYDIVVTNTNNYRNKFVAMTKTSFVEHITNLILLYGTQITHSSY